MAVALFPVQSSPLTYLLSPPDGQAQFISGKISYRTFHDTLNSFKPMPDSLMEQLAHFTAWLTIPIGLLILIHVSLTAGITVFVVGFLLLPLLFNIAQEFVFSEDASSSEGVTNIAQQVSNDSIEELQRRYARGEINEAELGTRLDTLLEMETIDVNGSEIEQIKQTLDTQENVGQKTSNTSAKQRDGPTERNKE